MKRVVKLGARSIEYTLIASPVTVNVSIKALPDRRVRVYAPKSARLRDMDRLVAENIGWIDAAHARLDAEINSADIKDGYVFMLEGRPVTLRIFAGARDSLVFNGDTLTLTCASADTRAHEALIRRWLCERALERIRQRLDEYAPGVGRQFGRVTIREQRTRWGSCSSKRNLNFNWMLILAPEPALTYVVVHELCHLIDFNHSPKFWEEVKKRMPDYEIWKKWLRTRGKSLVFP